MSTQRQVEDAIEVQVDAGEQQPARRYSGTSEEHRNYTRTRTAFYTRIVGGDDADPSWSDLSDDVDSNNQLVEPEEPLAPDNAYGWLSRKITYCRLAQSRGTRYEKMWRCNCKQLLDLERECQIRRRHLRALGDRHLRANWHKQQWILRLRKVGRELRAARERTVDYNTRFNDGDHSRYHRQLANQDIDQSEVPRNWLSRQVIEQHMRLRNQRPLAQATQPASERHESSSQGSNGTNGLDSVSRSSRFGEVNHDENENNDEVNVASQQLDAEVHEVDQR